MKAAGPHEWVDTGGKAFRDYVANQPGVQSPSSLEGFVGRVAGLFRRMPSPDSTLIYRQSRQLVVGSVQSGKTGTFIGAIVLAADNGFEVSIVLSGRLTALMYQTLGRICAALVPEVTQGLDGKQLAGTAAKSVLRARGFRVALVPQNSPKMAAFRTELAAEIAAASRSVAAGEKAHVVLVCLKTPSRLDALQRVLADASLRGGMRYPGLLIDDECDEASLNTFGAANLQNDASNQRVSTVSQRIQAVVSTYRGLQCLFFTATPQANLLLNISDALSPEHVYVLDEPPGYIGPDVLLASESQFLERSIPEEEVFEDAAGVSYPPDSLREAVAYFLWTAMLLPQINTCDFTSMLVHPSRLKDGHAIYQRFCQTIVQALRVEVLVVGRLSRSTIQIFRTAFDLLPEEGQIEGRQAVEQLEQGAIPRSLHEVLAALEIQVLNSDAQLKTVNWATNSAKILVGGDVLGRGFTVENLTTTYMPRGKAQALDTNLQRCRFFGYRERYVAWLRGWMDDELGRALVSTAYSERVLKNELRRADDEDITLRAFRRTFLLHPGMGATRSNVISMSYRISRTRGEWAFIQRRLLDTSGRPESERYSFRQIDEIVAQFLPHARDAVEISDSVVRPRQHSWVDVPFADVVQLIEGWPVSAHEVSNLNACALQIALHQELSKESRAIVIFVSPDEARWRSPSRKVDGDISAAAFTLHQGGQKLRRELGDDARLYEEHAVTVQIHKVRPRSTKYDVSVMPEVLERFGCDFVYGLAVRLPTAYDVVIGTP